MPTISNTNITTSQIVAVITVSYLNVMAVHHETWYVYHSISARFEGIQRKSHPSITPTLHPFKLLRQNFNIA
jgi:hypothetical protein